MTFRIVVGVNGSPPAEAAVRWALRHAEPLHGEVVAVFAWQMPLMPVPGGFDRDVPGERAKQFLLQAVNAVERGPEPPLESYVAEGDLLTAPPRR